MPAMQPASAADEVNDDAEGLERGAGEGSAKGMDEKG